MSPRSTSTPERVRRGATHGTGNRWSAAIGLLSPRMCRLTWRPSWQILRCPEEPRLDHHKVLIDALYAGLEQELLDDHLGHGVLALAEMVQRGEIRHGRRHVKLTRTTRPRSPSGVNGSESSHRVAPANEVRRPSIGRASRSPAKRWTIERITPGLRAGPGWVAPPDPRSVLGIGDVQRRPEAVGESAPDGVVVVDRHGVLDREVAHLGSHVVDVALEPELRRMNPHDGQPGVRVLRGPRADIRKRPQPVDAGVGP